MGTRYEINWDLPLSFDIGNWQVGAHPSWASQYPTYYGLYNNSISHSQSTTFYITARWEYIEFDYVLNAESGCDYLYIADDTAGSSLFGGTQPNTTTPITRSQTFDGTLRTLRFTYRKDGSATAGYDSCMILRMVVQTAGDELLQYTPSFALKDDDTGNLYILQDNEFIEVDIDLDSADSDTIRSSFMNWSSENVNEVINLNPFEKASLIMMDMRNAARTAAEYYVTTHNSILMDKTCRDYTTHEYIEAIDKINISASLQEGDRYAVAIGIDDDIWVLNNVDSEGNVVTYTTEELTPELILDLGFTSTNAVSDEIKAQLLVNRKLKFAYVLDVNSLNSITKIKDVNGTFVTTLSISED